MNVIVLIIKKAVIIFLTLVIVLAAGFFLIFEGNKNKLYDKLPETLQNLSFINQMKEVGSSEGGVSSVEEIEKLQRYLADLKSGTDIDTGFFQDEVFRSLKNLQKPLSVNLITDTQQSGENSVETPPASSAVIEIQHGRENPFAPIDSNLMGKDLVNEDLVN